MTDKCFSKPKTYVCMNCGHKITVNCSPTMQCPNCSMFAFVEE